MFDSHLVIVTFCFVHFDVYFSQNHNERQLDFDAKVHIIMKIKKIFLLIDTRTSTSEFVNINFVKYHKLIKIALIKFIKLRLIDNKIAFSITHMTLMKFQLNNHMSELWCLIISLEKFDIILGMPWMKQHDSRIFFNKRFIIFDSKHCKKHCIHNYQLITVYSTNIKISITFKFSKSLTNIAEISVSIFIKMIIRDSINVMIMWSEKFEKLEQSASENKYLIDNFFTTDVVVIFAENYEKFFSKIKKISRTLKQLKKQISIEFHEFINRWNYQTINKLSFHRKWDHHIDLKSKIVSLAKKTYVLSREQTQMIKQYIDEMLEKNFIRFSKFEYATFVLIVKKLENDLRVCVNYRTFNALIIKNRNASSLIKKTLTRLCAIKIYSKFDIIVVFNEVKMRKKDEKKIVFLTRYDLFEYVIMLFELCNALETFQSFINNTLREYLNDFCFNYLDDILIFNNSKEKHIEHVRKILKRLKEVNFFLNIDKCEFFVISVKYLKLIIIIDDVKMNSQKIEIIVNWKSFKCVKNVQIFLDFVNFYRKFIFEYFRLATSLNKLTKNTEADFAYFWNFDDSKEAIFRALKLTFITIFILQHFNSDFETWIETDVFDWIVVAIFSQRDVDEQLHSVIYMSKKMSLVECNYEIYDKKLLAIVRAFEKWRFECVEISMKDSVRILIDHKNLEHFMSSKQLNRRQARWIEFLAKFNFKIVYRSDVQKTKFDSLTRRSQNLSENNDDERRQYNHRILLKAQYLEFEIRKAIEMMFAFMNEREETIASLAVMLYELSEKRFETDEKSIVESSVERHLEKNSIEEKTIKKSFIDNLIAQSDIMTRIIVVYFNDDNLQRVIEIKRQRLRRIFVDIIKTEIRLKLENCEIRKNDLLWIKDRLYVLENEKFHKVILKQFHDVSISDHVDRAITYDRLSTHYYWFRMLHTVSRYIKNCLQCKRIKAYRQNKQDLLKFLSISERYFQNIFVDFITFLSTCTRHDRAYKHIMIVIDRLSKKKKFISLESFDVKIVVQIFLKWIWREKNYSNFVVSNRGTQFTSHFWKRLCEKINIISKFSIVWHFEIDDQIENVNVDLKVYLRIYVNFNQNDWINLFSIVEFEVNFVVSNFTDMIFFLTIKKYFSKSDLKFLMLIIDNAIQKRKMKDVDKFIQHQEKLREFLRNELIWAQIKQKKQINKRRHATSKIKVEDKIMFDSRFISTIKFNRELNYKNLELYEIIRAINNFVYELNLSKFLKSVFSVFHFWLLHLEDSDSLFEQKDHESNLIAIDSESNELWEVEKILKFKINMRMTDFESQQSDIKNCLCYYVKWVDWQQTNQRSEWCKYIWVKIVSHFVVDYHHKYPDKVESHHIFVRSDDWISSTIVTTTSETST